ncbi:MAG: ARC6/PARC6 family protein [Candidatus Obscuribacterales bacterium]|nr:ARC6/PARC6 family protein [Candidatus Obscuribacterales bacterium]
MADMTKHLLLLLLLFSVAPAQSANADDSGSLESMWMEPAAESPAPKSKAPVSSPEKISVPVETAPAVSVIAPAAALTAPLGAAPMCSWPDFKNSQFLTKSPWPGIGPFKPSDSDSSDLSDDHENRLKLHVASDQINRAELHLGKTGTDAVGRDFLDLEMTSDFLLEALGAKPKKIAEFNVALEKHKDVLMKGGRDALSFTAGRYLVTVDRSKSVAPYSALIAVNSLDASKSIIKEHSLASEEQPVVEKPESKISKILPVVKKTEAPVKKVVVKPIVPGDQKKEEFAQTIRNWQSIKKVAVRKRDTTQLSEILSGRALARQTDAVKWLATNKKYYEMVPKGVNVEKYQEITPGKKYAVMAIVREFSKFIDDGSGQVLKEVDDKYTVNYTMEKVGDHWNITDSQLLSTVSSKPTNKSTR